MDLSVVIPVYRSEGSLRELVRRLRGVLDETGLDYELVFIEDGSPDGSWGVLEELQSAHRDRIAAIQLMRNYGQQNAVMCGLRHATGEYVVTMDDDLQNPPEEIPKLLEAIERMQLELSLRRGARAGAPPLAQPRLKNRLVVLSVHFPHQGDTELVSNHAPRTGEKCPDVRLEFHVPRRALGVEH